MSQGEIAGPSSRSRWITGRRIVMALCVLAGLASFTGWIYWLRGLQLEVQGGELKWLKMSAVVVQLTVWFVLLHRSQRSSRRSARLAFALQLLISFFLTYVVVVGGVAGANRWFDSSLPSRSEWIVRDIEVRNGGPRLTLSDVRAEATVNLTVTPEVAAGLAPGHSHVFVTACKGALGWLRIVDVTAAPLPEGFDMAEARRAHAQTKALSHVGEPRTSGERVVIVVTIVVVGFVVVLLFIPARRAARLAHDLAARWRGLGLHGTHAGLEFRLSDSELSVLPPPADGRLAIERRSVAAKWVERLKLARPVASGDEAFDRDFLVMDFPDGLGSAFISDDISRTLVRELLDSPGSRLLMDREGLTVGCTLKARPDHVQVLLERLTTLHGRLSRSVHRLPPRAHAPRRWLRLAGKLGIASTLFAGVALVFGSFDEFPENRVVELVGLASWSAGVLWIVSVPLILWYQRRILAASHLILGMPVLAGFLCWVVALMGIVAANRFLDPTPPRTVETRLLGIRNDRLLLESWDEGTDIVSVLDWPDDSDPLRPPADVVVHLRDGALGFERIVSVVPAGR